MMSDEDGVGGLASQSQVLQKVPAKRRERSEVGSDMSDDFDIQKKARNSLESYKSTRERVIMYETSRVEAELAGQVNLGPGSKDKTGYQLYHMHRVSEIKDELGVKHHEAFKRAAKDWSKLPEEEKEWYNKRAEKNKPQAPKAAPAYDVDVALDHMMLQVDYHPTVMKKVTSTLSSTTAPSFKTQSSNSTTAASHSTSSSSATSSIGLSGGGGGGGGGGNSHSNGTSSIVSSPEKGHVVATGFGEKWTCSSCGNDEAGAPGAVCLMCAAFGNATFI